MQRYYLRPARWQLMTISIRNALILSKKKISIPFSRQRLEWRKCARGIFSFQLFQFLFSAIQTPRVTWKRKFYIYNNYNYYIYKVYFTLISTHAQHRFQINWKLKSEIGERNFVFSWKRLTRFLLFFPFTWWKIFIRTE